MAFVKLDCGMLDSTIWIDRDARELFITALLMAEPIEIREPIPALETRTLNQTGFIVPAGWYGFIPAAGSGIVRRAGMDAERGLSALERLAQPETESRSQAFEGRRLVRVDGGYLALNYDKYRQKDHTAAERSARYRERKAALRVSNVTSRVTSRSVTQAEAEAEGYSEHPIPAAKPLTIADHIYSAYPRKVGKKAALNAIRSALRVKTAAELLGAVKAYAEAVAEWPASERAQFVPYPSTWFNRGSYDDDRSTWNRQESTQGRASFA